MPANCEFCFHQVAENDLVTVNELIVNKSLYFTDILLDVFEEVHKLAKFICQDCKKNVLEFYKFKQNVLFNSQLPTKLRDQKRNEILSTVNEFLDKIEEEVIVMDCHNCLSLVPFSSVSIMNNFVLYTPTVQASVMRVGNEPSEREESVSSSEQFSLLEPVLTPTPKKKRGRKKKTLSSSSSETLTAFEPSAPKKRGRKRKLPIEESVQDETGKTVTTPLEEPDPLDIHNIKQERSTSSNSDIFEEKCDKQELKMVHDKDEEFKLSKKYDYKKKNYKISGHSLTPEQESLLKTKMRLSKVNADLFKCSQCQKSLAGYAAIRYHILFKHILPRDTGKEWISKKVLESRKVIKTKGGSSHVWICVKCSKQHASAPSIRYHLKSHLKDAFDDNQETNNNKLELENEEN